MVDLFVLSLVVLFFDWLVGWFFLFVCFFHWLFHLFTGC